MTGRAGIAEDLVCTSQSSRELLELSEPPLKRGEWVGTSVVSLRGDSMGHQRSGTLGALGGRLALRWGMSAREEV